MGENINADVLRERAIENIVIRLKVLNERLDKKMQAYTASNSRELEKEVFDLKDEIRKLEDKLYDFEPNK